MSGTITSEICNSSNSKIAYICSISTSMDNEKQLKKHGPSGISAPKICEVN
jgi:hypothetical protein